MRPRPTIAEDGTLKIDIEGIGRDGRLRDRIVRGLEKTLSRTAGEPKTALVTFADVNGPKGGVDTRCAITVWLPRRPAVHVEELATAARPAFAGAMKALERKLGRQGGRFLEDRRRPKKYYLAKRLLEPETSVATAPSPERVTPPPAKRRRRSAAG